MSHFIARIPATMRLSLEGGLLDAIMAVNEAHGFPTTKAATEELKQAHANLRMTREIPVEFWIRKDGTFELEVPGPHIVLKIEPRGLPK
jgi:hypothetical protein